jgi:hypothetical protein
MRILLITPVAEGERHSYTASLAKSFFDLGHEVIHFSQNYEKLKRIDQSTPAFAKKSKYLSSIYFKFSKYGIKQWKIRQGALINWQFLFKHINNLRKDSKNPDLLFFESLDASVGHYVTKRLINKKLNVPFSGILVCPENTRLMTKSYFRRGPFDPYNILKSKWCTSIGVVIEEAIPVLAMLVHKPVIVLPDIVSIPEPVQDNSLGELIRNRAGSRFVIGIWGSLAKRKGISEFLQMSIKEPAEKYFFVMGGRIKHEGLPENDINIMQQSISGKIGNLLIVDKWLSDDELFSGMLSCNLIFAAYPEWRFSSGIIGHAAVAKVPILVNDGFEMAKRVRDFKIGFVKENLSDVAVWISDNIDAIIKLKSSSVFEEGCSKYCETYGYGQWCKSLGNLIKIQ